MLELDRYRNKDDDEMALKGLRVSFQLTLARPCFACVTVRVPHSSPPHTPLPPPRVPRQAKETPVSACLLVPVCTGGWQPEPRAPSFPPTRKVDGANETAITPHDTATAQSQEPVMKEPRRRRSERNARLSMEPEHTSLLETRPCVLKELEPQVLLCS